MATYGQTIDLIVSQLGRLDSSITIAIQQEILNACEHYNTYRFWFNESNAPFTTSTGQSSYTGTTDILEIDSMMITIGGSRFEIERENFAVLDAMDLGGTFTGQPTKYAFFGNALRLYPTPNATYTVSIAYQQRLATLSATTDTNGFLTYGLDLIVARAQKVIHLNRFRDSQAAQMNDAVEQAAFNRLLVQADRLMGTGSITPSD